MNEIFHMIEKTPETSDQTRLLVLNVLIEAARAGEAGKDLALIANELLAKLRFNPTS